MYLHEKDWIFLNNIIYKIYALRDQSEMRQMLLENLRILIPFEKASFFLKDPTNHHILCAPVGCGFADGALEDYIRQYEQLNPNKWINYYSKSLVFRDFDTIPDEMVSSHDYYRIIKQNEALHYTLTISLAYENQNLGVITLYRTEAQKDFEERDIFIGEQLCDHLSLRLHGSLPQPGLPENLQQTMLDYDLTKRESEILALLQKGCSNPEICDQLCIANTTLKKHISNIYRKTGVNNRYELAELLKK